MEAEAKHDFNSTAPDEMSFKRGNVLKVLTIPEEENWYFAELDGAEGLIPKNFISMRPHPWFFASCSRQEAEDLLLKCNGETGKALHRDGAFLIRPSRAPGDLSMSVKFGETVQHFKVLRSVDGFYFFWNKKFKSLNLLLENHCEKTVSNTQEILLCDMSTVETKHPFERREPEELSFQKEDKIIILDQEDKNWWKGKHCTTHEVGLIPSTFVKWVIPPPGETP